MSPATAKEISADAAAVAVSSELDGIFELKEEQNTALYSQHSLAGV